MGGRSCASGDEPIGGAGWKRWRSPEGGVRRGARGADVWSGVACRGCARAGTLPAAAPFLPVSGGPHSARGSEDPHGPAPAPALPTSRGGGAGPDVGLEGVGEGLGPLLLGRRAGEGDRVGEEWICVSESGARG